MEEIKIFPPFYDFRRHFVWVLVLACWRCRRHRRRRRHVDLPFSFPFVENFNNSLPVVCYLIGTNTAQHNFNISSDILLCISRFNPLPPPFIRLIGSGSFPSPSFKFFVKIIYLRSSSELWVVMPPSNYTSSYRFIIFRVRLQVPISGNTNFF